MPHQSLAHVLRRMVVNLALAYAIAAGVTLTFLLVAQLVAPREVGPGVAGGWVFEMSLLALGAPVLAVVLLILDVILGSDARPRRSALLVCLTPAAFVGLLAVFTPGIAYLVAWLLLVGLLLGLSLRLPQRPATTGRT